jgi:alpha-L-fucosidase
LKQASLLTDPKTRFHTSHHDGKLKIDVPESLFTKSGIQVIRLEFSGSFQLQPEQLITGKNIRLDFHNAIKHYSYSCLDYYNNHRSVVKEAWNFSLKQKEVAPVIYFTKEELGKEIDLNWNGQTQTILLSEQEKIPLSTQSGSITWGKRYAYGPVNSDFESNPGPITPVILPDSGWTGEAGMKWVLLSESQTANETAFSSRPIQSNYILQEIFSDKAQDQLVGLESGDGIEVWLNGENLVRHNNPRNIQANREVVLLPLKSGKNQLLVKFYNRYGYEVRCNLHPETNQSLYFMKLNPIKILSINSLELKLHHPMSIHQPIRMNNIFIKL